MKTINVNNYEEFAIDYMVGNLSAHEAETFSSFLAEHPDIADEVLLFETETFESKSKSFSNLKKEISIERITDDNFEEYCIASMEGDLDAKAEHRLKVYIGNNHERLAVKAQFENTKLAPKIIVYPHKENLKKAVRPALFGRRFITISASIAAASIIAFGLFFIIPDQSTDIQLANNTPSTRVDIPTHEAIEIIETTPEEPAQELEEKLVAKVEKPGKKEEIATPKPLIVSEEKLDEGMHTTNEVPEKLRLKKQALPVSDFAMHKIALATSSPKNQLAHHMAIESSASTLRSKVNKLLYTTVLAQGVKSINKMAETNFGYKVIEDDKGNPVRVIVKSRFGEINRTLAQR
jgi:hypothetical protein